MVFLFIIIDTISFPKFILFCQLSAIASTEAIEAVSVYVWSFSDVIDKVGPLWDEIKDFVDVVFVPYGKSEVPSNT